MKRAEEISAAFSSEDPEQRRRAVESLRELGSEIEAPARYVLRALGDDDWRVRKQAIEVAIALSPSADLLAGMVLVLSPGDNVGLRNAAVEALGAYGQPAVDALVQQLPALDADGRKLAAEALARTALPSALDALKPLLSDGDPNVRAAALDAIATVGTSAVSEAFEILSSFLRSTDEEAFVRLCALDGINRLGSLLPWRTIEGMLEDPVLERSALSAAGRSAHPEALSALLRAFERARGGGVSAVLSGLVEYARAFAQNHLLLRAEAPSRAVVARLLALSLPSNDDLPSRKAALIVAGALGIEQIAPIAAEALSDARLLAEADESLSLLGPRAVPALLERAAHADPDTCAACIEIVTGLADAKSAPIAVQEIRKWLGSAAPVVVRAGLGAITLLGDESCFATVSPWLSNEETSSAAETALAALAQRYPESARKLARAARSEGDEAHAAAVIHTALPTPIRDTVADDVAYLSALLSNPTKAVRRAALAGLGNAGSELGTDAAAFALTDEEPEVRHAAVLALSRLRTSEGVLSGFGKLLELVEKSDDQELVAAALGALAEAGDPRVLAVLRPLVRNAPPRVAVAAIEALAKVPDARRVDALIEGLSHGESEVVKASMLALGDTIDLRVLAHFGACLDHEAWDVRRLSADMLGRAGGESAVLLLRGRLATEDNPLVQEAISRALELGTGMRHTPLPPRAGSLRPR
ncbi:MAG TPA: HEAT repeat domain-containing protein [Polyangiaceae bacterium]|jgi:HEAT repeat protein|nr:HEAT repeat domain-containing protein [Polyangiaceae bacterium]